MLSVQLHDYLRTKVSAVGTDHPARLHSRVLPARPPPTPVPICSNRSCCFPVNLSDCVTKCKLRVLAELQLLRPRLRADTYRVHRTHAAHASCQRSVVHNVARSTIEIAPARRQYRVMERKVDKGRRKAELATDVTRRNESRATSSDFHYAVQISVRLLRPIGAWPLTDRETSRLKIVLHRMSTVIATFLLIFTIAPWIICIVKQRWGVVLILRTMCPLLFTITIFARYVLLLCHQKRLRSCVDRVADDWRCHTTIVDDRVTMLEYARLGRTFGIVSVAFMFSCGILFYALPLAIPSPIGEDNVTVRLHPSPCELLIFDVKVKQTCACWPDPFTSTSPCRSFYNYTIFINRLINKIDQTEIKEFNYAVSLSFP